LLIGANGLGLDAGGDRKYNACLLTNAEKSTKAE